jgi:hypothetical protein
MLTKSNRSNDITSKGEERLQHGKRGLRQEASNSGIFPVEASIFLGVDKIHLRFV